MTTLPVTRTDEAISLSAAQEVAAAVVAAAEDRGVRLAVAVADQRGAMVLLARMDGANDFVLDNAVAKARTAVFFKRGTGELYGYLQDRPALAGAMSSRAGIMASEGGEPLRVGEQVVGGIGASGANPTVDQECIDEGVRAFGAMVARVGAVSA